MKRNLFITFEGPEGAGKTTILTKIVERLEQLKIDIMATREPGVLKLRKKYVKLY